MAAGYQYVAGELRVYQGPETFTLLRRELERAHCRRAVVVCGRTMARSPALELLRTALGPVLVGVSDSVRENSPISAVEQTVSALRAADADGLIAVGGGSAAVSARAATIMLGEGKPLAELATRRLPDGKFDSPRLNAPKLPQFVVPTTPSTAFVKAGTAVHGAGGERLALFDPRTRARAVFVHPEFVRTAPVDLVRSASLNAFANAVEALQSPRCDPFSEALLMQALRILRDNVGSITGEGAPGREVLVTAALLCGRGTEQGGAGLASVLAHAIGHRSHVANGTVNAIVLPHTTRFNEVVATTRGRVIAEALTGVRHDEGAEASASEAVAAFLAHITAARRLRDIGVGRDDLDDIARAAMSDWFITRNARPVQDVRTVRELLDMAW